MAMTTEYAQPTDIVRSTLASAIGGGKTTACESLCPYLCARFAPHYVVYTSVEDVVETYVDADGVNRFPEYYPAIVTGNQPRIDRGVYTPPLRIIPDFQHHAIERQLYRHKFVSAMKVPGGMGLIAIFERHYDEDFQFVQEHLQAGRIKPEELEHYWPLREELVHNYPYDLVIGLHVDLETAMARIKQRARKGEENIDPRFVQAMIERFENWFAAYQGAKTSIDYNGYDINDPLHRTAIVEELAAAINSILPNPVPAQAHTF